MEKEVRMSELFVFLDTKEKIVERRQSKRETYGRWLWNHRLRLALLICCIRWEGRRGKRSSDLSLSIFRMHAIQRVINRILERSNAPIYALRSLNIRLPMKLPCAISRLLLFLSLWRLMDHLTSRSWEKWVEERERGKRKRMSLRLLHSWLAIWTRSSMWITIRFPKQKGVIRDIDRLDWEYRDWLMHSN